MNSEQTFTDNEVPRFLTQRIKNTNFVAIIYGVLAIPFSVITFLLFPTITWVPLLFLSVVALAYLSNKQGLHQLSRMLVTLGTLSSGTIYIAAIQPENEPTLASLFALNFLFIIPPWIVYDFREKRELILTVSVSFISLILFRVWNRLLEFDFPEENIQLFRDGFMSILCVVTLIIFFGGTLFFFNKSNLESEMQNDALLAETEKKNKAMAENEAKLQKYLAEVESKRTEDQKRQWAAEGLSTISKILQNNTGDFSKSYDALISTLVKHVNANQASLFVLEKQGNEEILVQKACYAYNRKKFINKTVAIGEGLVGQTYLEQQTTYLREIPSGYISITSGLGEAPPQTLLIAPLKSQDGTIGIIELASFSDFEGHVIEFIEKSCEAIHNFIVSARRNEETRILLAQTQQQAEEMRSQEEEMRQNMEELSATQDEMTRKEKGYLEKIEELEGKLAVDKVLKV
jgi:hypothetical protein